MTVIVGVRCVDGVVIGADSIATSAAGSLPTVQIPSNRKIDLFHDKVIVASTGDVGLAQRLSRHVDDAVVAGSFDSANVHDCSGEISHRMLRDCGQTGLQWMQFGLGFGALMAAPINDEPCLIEFDTMKFQPEIKTGKIFYAAMGSGQVQADPFLAVINRVFWQNEMPSVDVGKFGVYWALDHAIRVAPGGIGHPISIAVLKKVDGRWATSVADEFQEGAQYVDELESHIARFTRSTLDEAMPSTLPAVPTEL